MAKIQSLADGLEHNLKAFKSLFSRSELKLIKEGSNWTEESSIKFNDFVQSVADDIISSHPELSIRYGSNELNPEFIFRHSLVYAFYIVDLLQNGGGNRSPRKVPNDLTDINVVTFATFSDGLMSNDELTNRLFIEMRNFLVYDMSKS